MSRLFDTGQKKDGKLVFPFEYRPSYATDVRKTFEKHKPKQPDNVKPLRRK